MYHGSPWNMLWTSVCISELHCLQTQGLIHIFLIDSLSSLRTLSHRCWHKCAQWLTYCLGSLRHWSLWCLLNYTGDYAAFSRGFEAVSLFFKCLVFSSVTVNYLFNADSYDQKKNSFVSHQRKDKFRICFTEILVKPLLTKPIGGHLELDSRENLQVLKF